MKNSFVLILVVSIILSVGLGCSLVGRAQQGEDNKTIKDKAIDIAVGDEKIGIPECDEVVDFLNHEIDNPDDDFVTKAVKATALKKFKEKFREAIEENKTDKVELAKTCREFKSNLDIYKAERNSNHK
jgi:hypothetical protein